MTTSKIGYGMGKKDFERANCIRAFLGDTAETGDEIAELSCNLDDMTAEAVGFAEEALFEAGALEVYTVPVGMKKSRPGVLLTWYVQTGGRRKDGGAAVPAHHDAGSPGAYQPEVHPEAPGGNSGNGLWTRAEKDLPGPWRCQGQAGI